jgi:hypothetical protein
MEKKFIPMLLDDKNIMTDALAEELFDDGTYVENIHRPLDYGVHTLLGFINNSPCKVDFTFGSNIFCVTDLMRNQFNIDRIEKRLREILSLTIVQRIKSKNEYDGFFKFYEEVEE